MCVLGCQGLVETALSLSGKDWPSLASGCAPEIVGMINTPVPHFHLQAQPDQVESGLAEATPSRERQCTS